MKVSDLRSGDPLRCVLAVVAAIFAIATPIVNGASPIAGAANRSEGRGLLAISLTGSAVLSITDPLGRRMFYDPDSSRYVSDIPYGLADQGTIWDTEDSTASTPPSDRIEIPQALDGDYRIEVIGQGDGWFGIDLSDYDAEGGFSAWSGAGATAVGSSTVFIAHYSSRPGVPVEVHEAPTAEARERKGRLVVTLAGSSVLSLTDPLGRSIRYDPESNLYVSGIPGSVADRGGAVEDPTDTTVVAEIADIVAIEGAAGGDYRIEVIAQSEGSFGMSVEARDTAGGLSGWSGSGMLAARSRAVYIVRFSSRPGVPVEVHKAGREQDGPENTAPGTPEAAEMNTKDDPPVYIVVSTTPLGGDEVEYSYEVVNGGAIPTSAISIGDSRYGSQLLTWPIGATADSIPPDCYTSPIGWEFNFFTTEEQPTKYIYWLRTDPARDIFGGQRLGGFAVKLPHADSLYQTCSWIAHLTDGQEYEGVLQNTPVSVPPSSIEIHEGVEVTPNPGAQKTGIRFYSASVVRGTVDIYDVRGRLVRRLFEGEVKAGWNSVEWTGDDASGKVVPSGTYFVKIEAGERLRFARFVLVR